jgi:hypothetical protein
LTLRLPRKHLTQHAHLWTTRGAAHLTTTQAQVTWKMQMNTADELISWLMDGNPTIRWQTMRDLQGSPAYRWQTEQRRTLNDTWGAHLLALQAPDGS